MFAVSSAGVHSPAASRVSSDTLRLVVRSTEVQPGDVHSNSVRRRQVKTFISV